MSAQPAHAGPSGPGRAARGSACLNCRRRKLRCDGARPICGPCIRTNRQSDCEYTDGPARSPTQVLEDNIARIEARIYELEHPESVPPSVTLHHPRPPSQAGMPAGASMTAATAEGINLPIGYLAPLPAPAMTSVDPATEPSMENIHRLVRFFMAHSSQVGFFLHGPRFLESILLPQADARLARLSSALVNTVYLWGARFTGNDSLRPQEAVFLQRATQAVSEALAQDVRHNVVHIIQAEVLLANYFFYTNRLLEGRYHCNAAIALTLSCRLNKIRALQDPQQAPASVINYSLPQPSDAIEEGERINAFWSAFILDKCWAVAAGSPSHYNGSPGAQVDTPWPLDMSSYEQGGMPPNVRGERTVQAFLSEGVQNANEGRSSVALYAKAAALFERAARLVSQWTPNMAYADQLATNIFNLDSIIDRFVASLPLIQGGQDQDVVRKLLVMHTLALVATIQVQGTLKQVAGITHNKDLTAAEAAVAIIDRVNITQLSHVDPILAILWPEVCRVLFGEVLRLRTLWSSPLLLADQAAGGQQAQQVQADHNRFFTAIQKVLATMMAFGHTSPLMALQATKVQQQLEGISR